MFTTVHTVTIDHMAPIEFQSIVPPSTEEWRRPNPATTWWECGFNEKEAEG